MIHWGKNTEGFFYEDIAGSCINREVFDLVEGIEFINFDLITKQQSMIENYYRFLISKQTNFGIRSRINSNLYSKNFNYVSKPKKSDKGKFFGYSVVNTPLGFTTELNYSLDFWGENMNSKLASVLELTKIVDYYRFNVKYKKYETLYEYWDLYLLRIELEAFKKKLKRQKQMLTEFHFRNYFGNTNYDEILHSILDLKMQVSGFKHSLNIFNKKIQVFVNKNGIDCFYLRYTQNLFSFRNISLNKLWAVFNQLSSYNFIFKAHLFKNRNMRELKLLIFREVASMRKSILQKIPQVDIAFTYEKDFSEKKMAIGNVKGGYEKTMFSPQENLFIGLRSYINLIDLNANARDKAIRLSKLKRMIDEYEYKLVTFNIDQEFILKKAHVFKKEIYDLKTKLLVKFKVLTYRKKNVFKSKFEVNKWRDLEVIYLNLNVRLQKKIIEYFKMLMQVNINTL